VLQAYASLGGQDTGKKGWTQLLGKQLQHATRDAGKKKTKAKEVKPSLLNCELVRELTRELTDEHNQTVTTAQLLLRWGLENGAAIIPKTTSKDRLRENADIFSFSMSAQQVEGLQANLLAAVCANNPDHPAENVEELTRLCWRSDPLRLLDFD